MGHGRGMTLSTQLWSEHSDLASEALTHPFVCRLGDGSWPGRSPRATSPRTPLSGVLRPRLRPGPCSQPRHTHAARVGRSARRGTGGARIAASYATPGGASTWPASSLHRRPWPTPSSCSRPLRRAGWGWCSRPWLVHAALRMAWRGTRRGCGGTVGVVGADLRVTRIFEVRPPGWNDCSTNRQTTGPLCARPTGGRWTLSWPSSSTALLPSG